MTELYNVPRNTRVVLLEDAKVPPAHRPLLKGEVLMFRSTDGMYSYCLDQNQEAVHPAAWTEVELAVEE